MSLTLTADGAKEVKETAASEDREAAATQTSAEQVPNGLKGVSKSLVDRVRTAGVTRHKRGLP